MNTSTNGSPPVADPALDLFFGVAATTDRMVYVWSPEQGMLWTNEIFVRETGFAAADFRFENRDNPFIHPDDRPRVVGEVDDFLAAPAQRSVVVNNRLIDIWGRTRAISTVISKIEWHGEPALLMVSSLSAAGPVENDASYRAVVESAADPIMKLAPDGRIVYSNRRFHALVQLPVAEVAKRRLQDFVPVSERARIDDALLCVWRGEPRVAFDLSLQAGGEELRFAVNLSALPEDEALSALAILRDVTELRREQARRESAQAALEESRRMEAMGRLAGGIAHDFNSVLLVVKGWAALLENTTSEEDRRSAVAHLRAAADKAAALTRQLLSFARRDALPVSPVDVDEALRGTLPSLRRLLPPEMRVELLAGAGGARALLDDTQLTRILFNLGTNARDASAGTGRLTIVSHLLTLPPPSAQLRAPDPTNAAGYVEIEVGDTGAGIAPEALQRLFEPFFTTKGAGRGTGLGLASVYGIVRQLGGYIWVESQLGQGTTVRIGLPVADVDAAAAAVAAPARPPVLGQGRIMVVEDDVIIRQIMTTILQRAGFGVVAAADGDEALRFLSSDNRPFDLLCTDGMLPGLPPHQLIDRVRARSPATRVLVVSGLVADEPALQQLRAGALPYLAKPFEPDELVTKVNQVLGRA
jgi:PAS domain S-box-containing protein